MRRLLALIILILLLSCTRAEDVTPAVSYSPSSTHGSWVAGDMHTHSVHSDGFGTIFENFAAANQAGMDFVVITDHNNSRGWEDAQIAGSQHDIIPIRGNEYTRSLTHALFINADSERDYSDLPPVQATCAFRVDSNNQGLVYVAHPFVFGEDSWLMADAWGADIDGIEVWNGWYSANHISQVSARQRWDELNNEGRRLFGIATTDSHSANTVGAVFTTIYVEQISAEGIIEAMRLGRMYGSNGPVIDFRAGASMMGDVFDVPQEGQTVTVNLSGEYVEEFEQVLLIKNGIAIDTRAISATSFDYSVDVFVLPGDLLRMEAFGIEQGVRTHTYDGREAASLVSAPFAFSNPIFFESDVDEGENELSR